MFSSEFSMTSCLFQRSHKNQDSTTLPLKTDQALKWWPRTTPETQEQSQAWTIRQSERTTEQPLRVRNFWRIRRRFLMETNQVNSPPFHSPPTQMWRIFCPFQPNISVDKSICTNCRKLLNSALSYQYLLTVKTSQELHLPCEHVGLNR